MSYVARLIFFALALLLGFAAWLAFARAQTPASNTNLKGNMNVATHATVNMNAGNGDVHTPVASDEWSHNTVEDVGPPEVWWTEPKPLYGYTAGQELALRSSPDDAAAVVERLSVGEYEQAEILEVRGRFLRVRLQANADASGGTRERDTSGWVEWGEVVPHASALVIDAETGEVETRVPLEPGVTFAAFSPDGKRALFYGTGYSGHGDGPTTAVELDTETFKTLRAVETNASSSFAAFLYDGDHVIAIAQQIRPHQQGSVTSLHPFRLKGELIEPAGSVMRGGINLVVASEGHTGILIHDAEDGRPQRIDILDLRTMEVRNSFETGNGSSWLTEYALNRDGSELYFRESVLENRKVLLNGTETEVSAASGTERIVVLNTLNGRRLRELSFKVPEGQWASFWQNNLAGDSVLVKFWRAEGEEEQAVSEGFWLKDGGAPVKAERGIDNVIEVGGALYAINDTGTRLFKLDDDNRITRKFKIPRPEVKPDRPDGDGMTIMGIQATPDGKRIIIFLGVEDSC